MKIFRTFS